MFGFSPISTTPFSSLPIGGITNGIKIPVEIIATVRTVIEQIDMPIEILRTKTDARALKWVLSSRGEQWVLDLQSSKWVLTNRNMQWFLDSQSSKWVLSNRDGQWVLEARTST